MSCGKDGCKNNNAKFYFVAFQGIAYQKIPKEMLEQLPEEDVRERMGIKEINGKLMMSGMVSSNICLKSETGLFIPSYIENYIKMSSNVNDVKITFVKELSEEEYKEDAKIAKMLSKKPEDQIVTHDVQSEIDDLIGRTEQGNLRIIVDPNSEKPEKEFGGLFDADEGWEVE